MAVVAAAATCVASCLLLAACCSGRLLQNVVCLRLIQRVLWVPGSSFLCAVFIDHLSMFASASCIIKLLHNISGFSLADGGWLVGQLISPLATSCWP